MPASPIKHARIDRNLTLFDLGRLTRINPGRLSMIERSLVTARPDEVERIAVALGTRAEELFATES